ncbi:MAG: GNAT family N-acetyltransferase [Flavobacteriaceae bacterium]|nr:GNAT family N-acetyltransferase [Flavobacteriaceae bacterium]
MIRSAKILEIPEILLLTQACALDMISRDIFQWNEHYPSAEVFREDIKKGRLYVLEQDSKIIGIIALCTEIDEEYKMVEWLTDHDHNLYVHRLAVHPDYQGKGNARKLMDFAEKHARDHHYTSIRLDTFSQNKRNQRFYEERGYTRLGDVYFPKQSPDPFHCYELCL